MVSPLRDPRRDAIASHETLDVLRRMDTRLESMDGALDSIDDRLDSIDDRLVSMDGKLGAMDSKLDQMGTNVAAMLGVLVDIRDGIRTLVAGVEPLVRKR